MLSGDWSDITLLKFVKLSAVLIEKGTKKQGTKLAGLAVVWALCSFKFFIDLSLENGRMEQLLSADKSDMMGDIYLWVQTPLRPSFYVESRNLSSVKISYILPGSTHQTFGD